MELILNRTTFWDIDIESIDPTNNSSFIIERIFSEGLLNELKQVLGYYSKDKIINSLKNAAYLDDKTLNFCCYLFDLEKEDFKCFFKEKVEPNTLELLNSLMSIEELKDFTLVGGTALTLQLGHRISYDIDLFKTANFNEDEILSTLESKFELLIRKKDKNYLLLDIKGIRVDLLTHKYEMLSNCITEENIRTAGLPDIAAMKLNAIANRGSKKDFWDLFYLLNYYTFSEMLEFFSKKYKNRDLSMVLKSLTYFEDADKMGKLNISDDLITWDTVKNKMIEEVKLYLL